MIEVRVPASSANIGSGFDCFGIALSLYNTIRVCEIESGLYISNSNAAEYIPNGINNLIYRSAMRVFDEVGHRLKGLKINQNSNIPMTRGLGSSSACIIGGLLAGNAISGRKLDMQRIFELANEIEGHPDNVAPALFGGFCISCIDDGRLLRKTIRIKPGLEFIAMIPEYYMVTKKSRELLPKSVKLEDASYNIAHAASFAASLAMGDYENLDIYCNDRLHQLYRADAVSDMEKIFEESKRQGACGVYLSGSGPTVIAIVKKDNNNFIDRMNEYFKQEGISRKCKSLYVDNVGAILKETKDL